MVLEIMEVTLFLVQLLLLAVAVEVGRVIQQVLAVQAAEVQRVQAQVQEAQVILLQLLLHKGIQAAALVEAGQTAAAAVPERQDPLDQLLQHLMAEMEVLVLLVQLQVQQLIMLAEVVVTGQI
jgi:hypothetical protein